MTAILVNYHGQTDVLNDCVKFLELKHLCVEVLWLILMLYHQTIYGQLQAFKKIIKTYISLIGSRKLLYPKDITKHCLYPWYHKC